MEKTSFREILRSKMKKSEGPFLSRKEAGKSLPEGLSEISLEHFFFQIPPLKTVKSEAYPRPQNPKATPPPKKTSSGTQNHNFFEKTMEERVKKSKLDEISQAKWSRFEKMVGQNFGDSLTKSQVLRSFRSFLKQVHPDLASSSRPQEGQNFATYVKIKDELLEALQSAEKTA